MLQQGQCCHSQQPQHQPPPTGAESACPVAVQQDRDTAVDVQQQVDQQTGLPAGAVNIRQKEFSMSYHGKAVVLDKHPVGTSTQSAAARDCATIGLATSAAALGDSIMPDDTFMMPAQAQHKPGSSCAQQQGTPDAAAATAAASAAVSTGGSYRVLLGELTQDLQDSTCDVGLQVLWELAEQISADAAAAAQVPVLDLLLLLTSPTAIEACEEAVRAFDSPERASSMRVLRGLLQLLAQPMVAAVLGWGQAQLQQQQATLKDLNSRAALLAAEVTAAAQRNAHASPACSEQLVEPNALGTASCAGAMDQVHTEQQAARAGHEVPAQLLPVGMGARTSSEQQPSASATAKPVEAPSAVHGGCGSCSGLSDAAAQAAAANAAAAVTKHAISCATSSPPTGAVRQKTLQQVQHMPSAPSGAAALHYAAMQAETTAAAAPAPEVAPNATPAAAPELGVLQTQQQQLTLLQLLQQQQQQQRFHMQLQQSVGLAAVLVAPAGAQRAAAVSQLPGHEVGQVAWQWTGTLGAPSGFLRSAPTGAGPLRSAAVAAAGTPPQIRPPAAPSSAAITAAAPGTNAGIATAATATAAAVAAAAAGPTAGNHSQLTVTAASERGTALRRILLRWIKACPKDACSSSTGQFLHEMPASNVLVADLLPHIDSLLTHIEGQAAPTTLHGYVAALCSFLKYNKSELQQGCPAFHSIQQKAETAKAGYNRMAQAYSKGCSVKGRSTKMRRAVAASGPAGASASARLQCGTAAASTAAVSQATAAAEAAAAAAILTQCFRRPEAAGHLQHTSRDTEVTAASTEGTTFADLQQQLQQAGHVDAASSLSVLWHAAQARFGMRAPPAKVQVKPLLLDYTAPQTLQLLKQAAVHVATAAIRQAAQQLLASLVQVLQTQQGGVLLGTELRAERCAQVLAVWQEVQSAAPLQDSQSEVQNTHRPMARSVPSDQMSGPQARGLVVAMQALQQQQQQDDGPSDSTPSFGSSGLTFSALHAALQSSTDSSKALAGYQLLWQFACRTLSGQPGNSAATVTAASPDATQVQVSPVLRHCMEYAANALEQLQTDIQNEPAHADAAAAAASTALAQTTSARLLLPLLSEPVIMGLLPTQEFHQLKRLLVQLVSVGESAKGAAEQGHKQGTLSGLLASGPRMQQQQQPQQQLEDPCLLDSSAGEAAAMGTVDVYAYSEATASVAAAAEPDMSLAALLGQLQQSLDPASSSASNCAQHLVQLREQATARFQGMNPNDIPAVVVVMNHFCAVEEGVRQVLTAAHALPGVLLAAQQDIDGLLQLAEQPPMFLLFTQSELHSLLEGLLGCRNQITECCWQLRG